MAGIIGSKIADLVEPEIFVPYVTEQTTFKSRLVRSGIIVPDAELDRLAATGGRLINMPFFKDLDGDDEVLSETTPLTPGKVQAAQDLARLHMRGKAWGVGDIAKALSGADPMAALGDMVADYWVRMEQKILIATLAGVFADNATNDAGDLISDISVADGGAVTDANKISAEAIIDARTKLGDAADKLVAIAMHSIPYSRLQKLNLIDMVPDSDGKLTIPTYLGLEVIVDDTCPAVFVSPNVEYTSYLFGKGAIGRGEGSAPVPVETDRDSLQGEDYLIHRRHFLLHPRGIAWQELTGVDAVAGLSPNNTELAMGKYWNRVYQKKNIRLVKLVTNG